MANEMTKLLNKIERRIGTKALVLPDEISKDTWAKEVIADDTIPTYSRYFPHKITVYLDRDKTPMDREGYYLLNPRMVDGAKIIGIKDINFSAFRDTGATAIPGMVSGGLGFYDFATTVSEYTYDDIALLQGSANLNSVFNGHVFVDFQYPNRVKFKMAVGRQSIPFRVVPLDVFVEHPLNLMTIPPTSMETFEKLAIADVATYLYEFLKYYDDLETVFANSNLKLDTIADKSRMRDEVVAKLEESYVSPANKNQPIMICV
ncbi:MAG: hypothetical protein IJ889_00325 [Eubacterium sp.]|nr:hypothetical protein [Eubacterium sp.]MBR2247279.1 hypothetical protein [Bacilli bacterium]